MQDNIKLEVEFFRNEKKRFFALIKVEFKTQIKRKSILIKIEFKIRIKRKSTFMFVKKTFFLTKDS